MRTKLSLLTIVMFLFVLLAGCVVRTHHHGHGHHKRGRACPPGWQKNHKGACYKKGPPPGHVKTRDHR